MKIKILLVCILIILSIQIAFAEEDEFDSWKPNLAGGFGYFLAGFQEMDLNSLNYRLVNSGYSEFSSQTSSFGGGGYGVIGRFLIGGEGFGTIEEEVISPNALYRQRLSGGVGIFKFGYIFYSDVVKSFYAVSGIGGGSLHLKIIQNAIPDFQGLLKNPLKATYLHNEFFLMNIGVGGIIFYDHSSSPKSVGGFMMGFEVGYNFSITEDTWYLDTDEVELGPKTGIDGIYFRLNFGGGFLTKI
ncbi:MAG: hypothetical protein PHV06_08360 [bacterium]|nr:hypothetical protein [bacterium]